MSRRKSRCNSCNGVITEKQLAQATDKEQHIAAYGMWDDDLVWVGTDGRTMCFGSHFSTEHSTDKEMTGQ